MDERDYATQERENSRREVEARNATTGHGRPHVVGSGCHPLIGIHVEVVDVKSRTDLDCVGRMGFIKHEPTFGHDYLSFDDGGSLDPDEAVVERTQAPRSARNAEPGA